MKRTRVALLVLTLLAAGCVATAFAAGAAGRYGWLELITNASWPGRTGKPGIYYKTGSGLTVRNPDDSETGPLGTGGGGGSNGLKAAYDAASSSAQNILAMTSTLGPVIRRDNATPLSFMSRDTNSAGTIVFDEIASVGRNAYGPFNFGTGQPFWLYFANSTAATSGAPVQVTHDINANGTVWDGAASRAYGWHLLGKASSGASYTSELDLNLIRNGVEVTPLKASYNGSSSTVTVTGAALVTGAASVGGALDADTLYASNGISSVLGIGSDLSNLHTLPSGTGPLCSSDAVQTLTNKTLTAPVINGATGTGGTFTGTITSRIFAGGGAAPSTCTAGAALGTGGSCTIVGSQTAMEITINTGTGATTGTMFTVTGLATNFATTPYCVRTPSDAGSGTDLYATYYSRAGSSGSSLVWGTTYGLQSSVTYRMVILCMQ